MYYYSVNSLIEYTTSFILIIIFLDDHWIECKSQSIWYPAWFSKDLGSKSNQNIQVGSRIIHIPVTSTDTPLHVDLNPKTTEIPFTKFPEKVNFLVLKNHQCLLKLPMKREKGGYKRRFVGITEGIFPYPENKNRFVICQKRADGNIECLEIDCLKGTYFDSLTKKCRNNIKENKSIKYKPQINLKIIN
ncbi:hypothetical protein HHI36_023956 [Cryptolaemus montrouzieri]|uniref:Uncharacterized protein n=1 Tax=Cryptolaemus montrouzieri TaxID=559131 RepID=A0ABD2PHW7_9CUCU